jgi:ketosteroid isomerase-like protein
MKDMKRRTSIFPTVLIFAITLLFTSCTGTETSPIDIVSQYYNAIEAGDADAAAAFFSEDAMIVTPSGNTLQGESGKDQFINYDLQFMDHVDFQSEFTENDGKIMWKQEYYHIDGNTFVSDCEVTVQDGKIVEWIFN